MFWAYLSTFGLTVVGVLLMLIILLQRGRGGGLAGAFGGLGGQSAFGTKAGDVFTKITVVLTVIWVALAGASIWALESGSGGRFRNEVPEEPPGNTAPSDSSDSSDSSLLESPTPGTPTDGTSDDRTDGAASAPKQEEAASAQKNKTATDGEKPKDPKDDETSNEGQTSKE